MIVRHKLLADLVRLWKNDQLIEKIDRLPVELSPRRSKPMGRCRIHKVKASGTRLCTQRTSRVEIQDVPPNGTGHDRRT